MECLVCEWNANDPLIDGACFEATEGFYIQECPANTTASGPSYCLSEFIFDDGKSLPTISCFRASKIEEKNLGFVPGIHLDVFKGIKADLVGKANGLRS